MALKNNPKSPLTHLDISENILDERGNAACAILLRCAHKILQCFLPSLPAIESLGAALESLPHGLSELSLANCRILPRGQHQQVLLPDCAQLYKELERVIYMMTLLPPLSNPSHRWVPLGKLHEAEQNNAVFSGPLGPLWQPSRPRPPGGTHLPPGAKHHCKTQPQQVWDQL